MLNERMAGALVCAAALLMLVLNQVKAAGSPAPVIKTVPDKVLEFRNAAGRALNFDFRITNPHQMPLDLAEVRLIIRDEVGEVLSDLIINQNGIAPGILTIPNRTVAPGGGLTVFNPYPLLPAGISGPVQLRYEFRFDAGEGKVIVASKDVDPVPYVNKTKLRFPLEGRVLVWDGHDFLSHHRRLDFDHPLLVELGMSVNTARYAYDFTRVDSAGKRFTGEGAKKDDHFSYGVSVHATADGVIAFARDGVPENAEVSIDDMRKDLQSIYGNSIVIDHGNGEFSRFGHLQTDSVQVKVGDRVKGGQVIGRVGNSGSSLFPHLHYELVSGVGVANEGLPSIFVDLYRVLGTKRVKMKVSPDSGDIVEKGGA
jgi:hypothetical protein